MTDYKEMYNSLFNKITETIENLQDVQKKVEELYLSQEDKTHKN